MTKYRKIPVEVEAMHWDGTLKSFWNIKEQLDIAIEYYEPYEYPNDGIKAYKPPYLLIKTLAGNMRASVGDYIIKDVQGEVYPCKPAIFETAYEEIK